MVLLAGLVPVNSVAGEDEIGLKFSGDLRGRFESFWFDDDAVDEAKDDRNRIRYRLRFNAKADLNSRAMAAFRIGTGSEDSRSGNQTLGDGVDFGPNGIAVRNAYLQLTPWEHGKLHNGEGHLKFQFGRVPNPFVWKKGQDKMLWDNGIALSGVSALFGIPAGEAADVMFNGGWYQIDENSSGSDPQVAIVQAGITAGGDAFTAGVKGTYHHFTELDSSFVQRGEDGLDSDGQKATSAGGNILDGLTGSYMGGTLKVFHVQGYATAKAGEVPVTAYGGYSVNTSAEESEMSPGIDKEEVAYSGGIEAGDKKKWVKLGIAWFHIQANAFPAQFIDSDFLDGRTNREGLMVYGSRQILDKTEFGFKLFNSDAIETEADGLSDSVKASKRTRLQVDLVYEF
jgi:hypothetical protein